MANRKTSKSKKKATEVKSQLEMMDDKDYQIEWVCLCRKEAAQATKKLRTKWKELWQCYQNVQDYHKKEDWQSQMFIPKLFMAIERSALLIQRAILQTNKLFKMELDDEFIMPLKSKIRHTKKELKRARKEFAKTGKEIYLKLQKIQLITLDPETKAQALDLLTNMTEEAEQKVESVKENLEKLEDQMEDYQDQLQDDEEMFKAHLKKSNMVSSYGEMIKPASLLGFGCIKRAYKTAKKRLFYENKAIRNLYISPDFKPFQDDNPAYLIDSVEINLADLIDLAKETNAACVAAKEEPVYDMDEIDLIQEDFKNQREETDENAVKGLDEHTPVTKKVVMDEFWGDVISEDGREKKKNQLIVIVNEKYRVRSHDNPFKSSKIPFEFAVPICYPGRGVAGVSMVESQVKLQYTLNNMINMVIDNMNFIVNRMWEYNPYDLQDPTTMMRIFPGKTIQNRTHGTAIWPVKVEPLTGDVYKTIELLIKELQEGNAVTEFLTAMPGTKTKTLGEIEIKTAESHGYFDVIARMLEVNSIRPLLRDSYEMLCQFRDDYDNFERYQFNVGGLSLLLLQKQQVEYLVQALSLALKFPNLGQWTKLMEVWQRLLSIWNLDDAYVEPDDEMQQQQQLMAPQEGEQKQVPAGNKDKGADTEKKAAADAKQAVGRMSPQEIMSR